MRRRSVMSRRRRRRVCASIFQARASRSQRGRRLAGRHARSRRGGSLRRAGGGGSLHRSARQRLGVPCDLHRGRHARRSGLRGRRQRPSQHHPRVDRAAADADHEWERGLHDPAIRAAQARRHDHQLRRISADPGALRSSRAPAHRRRVRVPRRPCAGVSRPARMGHGRGALRHRHLHNHRPRSPAARASRRRSSARRCTTRRIPRRTSARCSRRSSARSSEWRPRKSDVVKGAGVEGRAGHRQPDAGRARGHPRGSGAPAREVRRRKGSHDARWREILSAPVPDKLDAKTWARFVFDHLDAALRKPTESEALARGSLLPLYQLRTATFIEEVRDMTTAQSETVVEDGARVMEEEKRR